MSIIDEEKKFRNPPPPPPTDLSSTAKFQKCQNWIFFKIINKKLH